MTRAESPTLDAALDIMRNFKPRRDAPAALLVTVDGKPLRFRINKATGTVSATPKGSFWEFAKGLGWNDFKRFLEERRYPVIIE